MKEIQIRQCVLNDAEVTIPLLIEAMGDITHRLSGSDDIDTTLIQLKSYFKGESSRLSYRHCMVVEVDGTVCGAIACYGGKDAKEYDAWIYEYLKEFSSLETSIETECDVDEFYIDSIAINPEYRGMRLSELLIEEAKKRAIAHGYTKISLIVDVDKGYLQHYYESLGFKDVGLKEVYEHPYRHMVWELL